MLPRTSCVSSWPTSLRGLARRRSFPSVWQRSPRWTPRAAAAGGGVHGAGRRRRSGARDQRPDRRLSHVFCEDEHGRRNLGTLTNTTNYDHPFHLHGFFFQVLDIDGAEAVRAWRDTVSLVPRETAANCHPVRRPRRHVDVPLSHPRPRGSGDDGDAPPDAVNRPSDEVRGVAGRSTRRLRRGFQRFQVPLLFM